MTKRLIPIVALLSGLTVTGCCARSPSCGDCIVAYDSGNFSELVASLPATDDDSPYAPEVIFSAEIARISEGDIIQVMAEFEVTNDLGYNCMIASQVVLADAATSTSGTEITEANGFNITPGMHHGTTVRVGAYVASEDYTSVFVNVIGYAASSAAQPGDTLAVEPDYGRLTILHIRV